ncbi:hypothetical protein SAY87_017438 [Trapa incisa]|uniref:glycerol-1-phosphatase n=2 Tax=Trapa TaxID=22665 RepID=A0AAN7L7R5_9MYRT|nr:hypothetical protein SAY87_017438 [Trapa incisa]
MEDSKAEDDAAAQKDPFAASDKLNEPEELVSGFKKSKDSLPADLTVALAELEVPTLPPAEATQSTHIGVEGFEGEYGGIEFGNEQASLGETFEGFSEAWGGGLDPSEFIGTTKAKKSQGLAGLELLQTGPDARDSAKATAAGAADGKAPLEDVLVQKTDMKGPQMFISEEINAEFRESFLARVGLMGVVYLRTLPPKTAGDKETEFSFRVDCTSSVKRFVMQNSHVSSLENGIFHVRTEASNEAIPILKYSLLPRLTPLPLRVRLTKRHSGTLLSVMIQYVSNPELPAPLNNVAFVLKLPVDPTLLKVSPKAVLNRSEKELKWIIPEIPLDGSPGKLRVRMPVDTSPEDGNREIDIVGYVKFSWQGSRSLSGVSLHPASEGSHFSPYGSDIDFGLQQCSCSMSELLSVNVILVTQEEEVQFSPHSLKNSSQARRNSPDPHVGMSPKGSITHVIFDMDGLLLDTEKFYTEVQEIILARYNKTFNWSLKAKMMGKKAIEAARVFVEETGISDSLSAEDFLIEREEMLRTMFPTSELMPGASRLIRHLHARGVPICLATGSHRRHFELKTQRHHELFSLMHHVVLGDDPDVKQGKPSPDIFLAAAKRFEGGPIDPHNILVFEDAPSGVNAAKNAGMFVVMVPDPRLDSSFHDVADQVLGSLLDFKPSDWDLPQFEDAQI